MFPMSHVRPIRRYMSTAGRKVNVKSLCGFPDSGSLKTLVSMPRFVSATVGFK